MPGIRLNHLRKQFRQALALDDVSLEIQSGERWALIGRSGVGKTTLLRVLCGLETVDAGEIWIGDRRVDGVTPRERNVALVTQDYPLYPNLSVQENLHSALAGSGVPAGETGHRIDEALEWFQIASLRKRLPGELSGGQAQRIALARALVRRPAILLLDEPLSQVDTIFRQEIRELILSAVIRYQTTLITVTHDPTDALWMATHLAVLEQARVVQQGTTGDVYRLPKSEIVAELLSPHGINWLDVTSQAFVQALVASSQIPTAVRRLGIRPEHIRCASTSEVLAPKAFGLRAKIVEVRACGFGHAVTAEVAGQNVKLIDWNNAVDVGEVVLSIPAEQCVWLRAKG